MQDRKYSLYRGVYVKKGKKNNYYVYLSSMMEDGWYNKFFGKSKSAINAQKFHSNLVSGLKNNGIKLVVVSVPPFNNQNSRKKFIFLKKQEIDNIKYYYLPVINIKFIRPIVFFISSVFIFLRFLISPRCKGVLFDALKYSTACLSVIVTKIFVKKTYAIYTDLPQYLGNSNILIKIMYKVINKSNNFILLSKYMNHKVNKKDKPHIVIEGFYDKEDFKNIIKSPSRNQIRKCMYAGDLSKIHGIERLIQGFIGADLLNTQLYLYGEGDFVPNIMSYARKHSNVIYGGSLSRDSIKIKEVQADLLINNRPSESEFSKYSFPSKTMEYLGSGTPLLMTKLPSIPVEYYPYMFFIDNETIDGVSEALRKVFSFDSEYLFNFGLKAKEFVTNHKNNEVQAKKIIDFFNF